MASFDRSNSKDVKFAKRRGKKGNDVFNDSKFHQRDTVHAT